MIPTQIMDRGVSGASFIKKDTISLVKQEDFSKFYRKVKDKELKWVIQRKIG